MLLNSFGKYLLITLLAFSLVYLGRRKTDNNLSKPQESFESGETIIPGRYYQVSISSSEINKYLISAEYRIWIPKGIDRVRGILIKQHGCGLDAQNSGLDHANDLQWQALALKYQFALMGTKLIPQGKECRYWATVNYASKKSFFHALDSLARHSGRSELKSVPWALWGHSGGANWATQMFQEFPTRTIAVVAARAGGLLFLGTNPSLIDTPVLFSLGENENVHPGTNFELPQKIFYRYRQLGALWSVAIEANASHETANTRQLAIPYLDAVINDRLSKFGNELRPIDRTQGWLADNVKQTIASTDKFEGNSLESSWLPNQEIAKKWQSYVTRGEILPTSKPHAPTNVNVTKISPRKVLVTWNVDPDLENGLPAFRIYRNNKLIHTIEKPQHNFHDSSQTAYTTLKFQDRKAIPNSTYTVAAFNKLGESISQPSDYW